MRPPKNSPTVARGKDFFENVDMSARTCKGSETLWFHLCALILCAVVATGGDGGDPLVEECRREHDAAYRPGGEFGGSRPAERAAALVSLGDELMKREKPGDAIVCYKLACSLEDGSRDAAGWRSLLMLGEALESAGEREEALIAFRNATQRTAGFLRGEMTSPWILTRCAHAGRTLPHLEKDQKERFPGGALCVVKIFPVHYQSARNDQSRFLFPPLFSCDTGPWEWQNERESQGAPAF